MVYANDYLSAKEKEQFHKAICAVLENSGVCFQSEEAVNVFKKHGAKTDGKMVYISEKLLMSSLKNAPRSFEVYGRTKEKGFTVGGSAPALAPASGPVFVKTDDKRELASSQDYSNFLKLTETSNVINFANYIVVEPQDMPENKRKLYQIALTLAMTTKPLVGMAMGEGMSDKALKLISDFYGGLGESRAIGIISPISPLVYDEHMLEHVFSYAKHKQPLMFASCSLPGATSPVTIAGTVVVDFAQTLAGIVLSQLVCPGLPVLFGSTSASCDMRYLSPAIGSPETGLISMATVSMSHHYNLPCRTGGTLSDSKTVDTQVGVESALTLLPALSAGADFILHAAGVMDSFSTVSLEKFVIDEETITFCQRLTRGFEVNEDALAVEVIKEIGSGNQFLNADHTLENYRDELYVSKVFSKEGYDKWEKEGKQALDEKAKKIVSNRLANYEKPFLEPEREKILSEYIANL